MTVKDLRQELTNANIPDDAEVGFSVHPSLSKEILQLIFIDTKLSYNKKDNTFSIAELGRNYITSDELQQLNDKERASSSNSK